jgi:hypothetical protein
MSIKHLLELSIPHLKLRVADPEIDGCRGKSQKILPKR